MFRKYFLGSLSSISEIIFFARACAFREACITEARTGDNNKWIAAGLVAIFDGPLIMSVLLSVDSLLFNERYIHALFPLGLSNPSSILYALVIITLEYFYFKVFRIKLAKTLAGVDDKKINIVGITYFVFVLILGGSLLFYLL